MGEQTRRTPSPSGARGNHEDAHMLFPWLGTKSLVFFMQLRPAFQCSTSTVLSL